MVSLVETLQPYEGLITLLLTFCLILATAYYARQTYLLNKITKETSEYERRPIIHVFCEYDELHRPSFGVKNIGSRMAEDILIKAHAVFGLSRKGCGLRVLELGPERTITPNIITEYKVTQLVPEEEARVDIFDKIIELLEDKGYIRVVPPEEVCGYHDSYGNWIVFPYRNEVNWSAMDSSELMHGIIEIETEFKPDIKAAKYFTHKRKYEIQIAKVNDVADTNMVYKNFVVITTWQVTKLLREEPTHR